MHFCNKCDNMYYIRLSGENNDILTYYCRNCGNQDLNTEQNIKISSTNVLDKNESYNNFVNKYTKYDNTLPRVNELKCPNTECGTNNEEDNDIEKNILLIRVNEDSMKYINLCSTCNTIWDSNIK